MSRKKAQKSEVIIGIFQGKQEKYNKAILETLLIEGPLTNWGMSKVICRNRYPDVPKETGDRKTQKIYQVIQKKDGRLQDLGHKQYIEEQEDGKWCLALKGIAAILILKPELHTKLNPAYWSKSSISEEMPKLPTEVQLPFIKVKVDPKLTRILEDEIKGLDNPKTYLGLAEKVKVLLEEGVDLDRINEDKLWLLIAKDWSTIFDKKLRELRKD